MGNRTVKKIAGPDKKILEKTATDGELGELKLYK